MSAPALEAVVRLTGEGLVVVDPQGRVVAASDAAAAALGYANAAELKDVPCDELATIFAPEGEVGERVLSFRDRERGWDRWVLIKSRPPLDQYPRGARLYLVQDVTGCRRREQAVRFLDEATTRLARSLSPGRALEHAAVVAVPYLADECVVAQRMRDGTFSAVAWHLPGGQAAKRAQLVVSSVAPLLAHVESEGRALLLGPMHTEPEAADNGSTLVVPVREGQSVTALMILAMASVTGRRHHPADRGVAEQLGVRVGCALTDARLRGSEQRRLRAADERESFLAQLGAELRTQLPALLSACDRLENTLPEGERRVLRIVREHARRLNSTMNRLLPAGPPPPEPESPPVPPVRSGLRAQSWRGDRDLGLPSPKRALAAPSAVRRIAGFQFTTVASGSQGAP